MRANRKRNSEEVLYRETLGRSSWYHVLNIGFGVLWLALIIWSLVIWRLPYEKESMALGDFIFLMILLLTIVWTWIFYLTSIHLRFEITLTEIRFGFGFFIKKFQRSQITSCHPFELNLRGSVAQSLFRAPGSRLCPDGTIAYSTRRKAPGVKIEITRQTEPYVIAVDDPIKVCAILNGSSQALTADSKLDNH